MSDNKLLISALKRLENLNRISSFDPVFPNSIPTPAQKEVLDEFGTIPTQYIVAGNQCLVGSTQVMTPRGPVALQDIRVGDTVYSEHGTEIKVKQTFRNGPKEVYSMIYNRREWARSTGEHRWLSHIYNHKDHDTGILTECSSIELGPKAKVARRFVQAPLGTESIAHTYVLGALQGDGCSREKRRGVTISSADDKIPSKIANMLGCNYKRNHEKNYNWHLDTEQDSIPHYLDWCSGLYAHEKTIELSKLKKWDRTSLLNWVAGLYDTEGSLSGNLEARTVRWCIGMQAKPVIEGLQYALLALWQIDASLGIDNRSKYKNGPVHILSVGNPHDIRRIMEELDPLIVSDQKRWKPEYNEYGKRSYPDRIALNAVSAGIEETYDIHVDSDTNLYLLANGLVTHNSGKSATCARIVSWVLEETPEALGGIVHKRRSDPDPKTTWGNESILIIVAGRTGKQIEESLLPKIRSYLSPGSYKEVRIGNIIQRLEHSNGNRIIFQSLENSNMARERLQSYVAHLTWLDEFPPTFSILDELQRRVQARGGYFLASFTPLVEDISIQRMVDNSKLPHGKKYQFSMLDNPLYADPAKREKILHEMSLLPESVRNTRLYGAWSSSDTAVYHFDYNQMVHELPKDYRHSWRHVVSVDPALKSALGLTVWAEMPITGNWYLVHAEEVTGIQDPIDLELTVHRKTQQYNVIRRISDPHEVWYMETARRAGRTCIGVYNKNSRKGELIKQLQSALGTRIYVCPHVTDFIDQLVGCKWATSDRERIINASSKHLLDSAQYFCDNIPKYEKPVEHVGWADQLYAMNEKRKELEARKASVTGRRIRRHRGR